MNTLQIGDKVKCVNTTALLDGHGYDSETTYIVKSNANRHGKIIVPNNANKGKRVGFWRFVKVSSND